MTEPLPPTSLDLSKSLTTTPSRTSSSSQPKTHRLLYRGALSLPDSHLPLDGLSFTANVAEVRSGQSPSTNLLDNPLALALESMRGRPSLHFLGTECLKDVWLDTKNDINVYVHPYSVLSRIYFENILCLTPVTSSNGRTVQGIRVGLGDSNELGTTDFLIYGQLRPESYPLDQCSPSTSSAPASSLHMLAARILPNPPPPPASRPPRPDDPTPRKPPAHLFGTSSKRKRDLSSMSLDFSENSKRTKGSAGKGKACTGADNGDEQVKMAREVMLTMPKPGVSVPRTLGKEARFGKGEDVFKIPSLPVRSQSQQDTGRFQSLPLPETTTDADVFNGPCVAVEKGKGRATEQSSGSDELEKANKTVVKQAAVTCLSKHGVRKGQPEFNELFQFTYRGVSFALRDIMRTQAVNIRTVDRLLEAHARMYVNGNGDNHSCSNSDSTKKVA